jgi:hypothetical protein
VDADEVAGLAMPTDAKSAAVTLRRTQAARILLELIKCILLLGCEADSAAQRHILSCPRDDLKVIHTLTHGSRMAEIGSARTAEADDAHRHRAGRVERVDPNDRPIGSTPAKYRIHARGSANASPRSEVRSFALR